MVSLPMLETVVGAVYSPTRVFLSKNFHSRPGRREREREREKFLLRTSGVGVGVKSDPHTKAREGCSYLFERTKKHPGRKMRTRC